MSSLETMHSARRGDWVQIHDIVLTPEQRTAHLPQDTQKVPFESWVKGFLVEESAHIGDRVTITTTCGRTISGTLLTVNPGYDYGFGDAAVPELLGIGPQARHIIKENDNA